MEPKAKGVATTAAIFSAVVGAGMGTAVVAVSEKIAKLKVWQKVVVVAAITAATSAGMAGMSYVAYSALTR